MRLEITRRTDLATRSLIALASSGFEGRTTKAADLAAHVGTTRGFLSQAMTPLVDRGWVRSVPGPNGGYSVAADLSDVSVLDVIEAVEGSTNVTHCVLQERPCAAAAPCALHEPWTTARHELLLSLATTSVADLVTLTVRSAPTPRTRGAGPSKRPTARTKPRINPRRSVS